MAELEHSERSCSISYTGRAVQQRVWRAGRLHMRDEQRIARELQERLGPDARVVGKGVHWGVEIGRAQRECKIACFWYGEASGLMLGMNPSNAREGLRPTYPRRQGGEYLVRFHDGERRIAGGRTQDIDAVVEAVRAWLRGKSIAEVEQASPFVDKKRRRMRELLAILEPKCGDVARCEIDRNISFELWTYGRGRSCQLHVGEDNAVSASFRLGPAQVAFGDVTADPATPISRWLHGATLAELRALGVASEAHADLLEDGEAARWHWMQVRERIKDPGDVLEDSRPLIERLVDRELPTRFFSFSSLNRFCFSASSHYPWVNEGLPVICPPYEARGYIVEIGATRTECNVEQAIEAIEGALSTYPVAPFFGSAAYRTIGPLDAELAKAGSPLRAELRQRSEWFSAAVVSGDRYCTVEDDLCSAAFHGASDAPLRALFSRPADTIAAVRHWLEDRWITEQIRSLPSVVKASIDVMFDPD